ncbi:MAG TPA: EamA family transporter, partial [Patescibacteria group bacterium]|nr:EamA family transporter [Patescibacteria group bacterium]
MKTSWMPSGDALVLVAMAMFGSYPLFLRLCPQISPLTFLGAFQVVGMASFFIIARRQGMPRLEKRDYALLVGLAVAATLNDLCYFFAFTKTSVANAAVAHQSVSIFLLVLAPLLLRERTRKEEWLAFIISLVGLAVLYSKQLGTKDDRPHFVGITLGVVSGLCYAFLIVLYRVIPDRARGITISVTNFWRYAMSSILLIPFMPLMKLSGLHRLDALSLISFGLAFAVIASGIHNYGINRTRALHVSILGKSEPVFAIA